MKNIVIPILFCAIMLEIKIGDYGPYKFPEDVYDSVKIAKKFKVSEEYTVQVFNDGVQIQSWNLDFSNYEDQDVQIWRDKGAWFMNKKSDEL